jgi:hypothetical protein
VLPFRIVGAGADGRRRSRLAATRRPHHTQEARIPTRWDSARLRVAAVHDGTASAYSPGELVVSTTRGTPVNPTNWNHRVWTPALQHARLGDWVEEDGEKKWRNAYRWHDLRHTCVSRLVE